MSSAMPMVIVACQATITDTCRRVTPSALNNARSLRRRRTDVTSALASAPSATSPNSPAMTVGANPISRKFTMSAGRFGPVKTLSTISSGWRSPKALKRRTAAPLSAPGLNRTTNAPASG